MICLKEDMFRKHVYNSPTERRKKLGDEGGGRAVGQIEQVLGASLLLFF